MGELLRQGKIFQLNVPTIYDGVAQTKKMSLERNQRGEDAASSIMGTRWHV